MFQRLLIVCFVFFIAACGFQLRGDIKLPSHLQQLNVSLSKDNVFNNELLKQLKLSGASISDTDNAGFLSVRLTILPELAIAQSSSSGLEIEQLRIQLDYSVKDSSGQWLAQQKQISQSRDFEFDSNQVLAKNTEKQRLYLKIKQKLARIMIYQLQLLK